MFQALRSTSRSKPAMLARLQSFRLLSRRLPQLVSESDQGGSRAASAEPWLLAALFAVAVGGQGIMRVTRLLALAYDLGFYVQALNGIRDGTWMNSLFGYGVFSDHVSLILVPLALLPVDETAVILVAIQAVVLGLGIVPAYRLGLEAGGRRLARLGAVWYGASAAVWHAAIFDFHPGVLAIPLGMWVVLRLSRTDQQGVWVPLMAMVLIREDVSVLYGLFVLLAGIKKRIKSSIIAGVSAMLFGVSFMALMAIQPGVRSQIGIFFGFESLGDLVARPLRVDAIVGVIAVLSPFLFAPLVASWKVGWPGLLVLAGCIFSRSNATASIYFQYYAQAIPFLIGAGTVVYASRAWQSRYQLALVATLVTFLVWGPWFYFGYGSSDRYLSVIAQSGDRAAIWELIDEIPRGAEVSADHHLAPAIPWGPVYLAPGPMVCGGPLSIERDTRAVRFLLVDDLTSELGPDWRGVVRSWGYALKHKVAEAELWELKVDLVPSVACPGPG